MIHQRTITILLIILAELGYALVALDILADIANPAIPYSQINVRLIWVGIGILVSPIIISHAVYRIAKGRTK
jgi:hypothetical protein